MRLYFWTAIYLVTEEKLRHERLCRVKILFFTRYASSFSLCFFFLLYWFRLLFGRYRLLSKNLCFLDWLIKLITECHIFTYLFPLYIHHLLTLIRQDTIQCLYMYRLSRKHGERECNMNLSPKLYCSAPEDLKHCNKVF